jgi:geranylgeranyl pyrophosphate synthase
VEASAAIGERHARDTFGLRLKDWQARMERALDARMPSPAVEPRRLHEAMRYSVLGSGKRVRPALLFATAATLGLQEDEVEGAACAVELIHAYSLVHDDLPAMDNDDLRRGRPTCHRAFDEATAILVGDALQPLAFEILARDPTLPAAGSIRVQLIGLLAEASGSSGMAGGQAIDLAAKGRALDIAGLEQMHERKTGALIRASVLMAAACVPALAREQQAALATYAQAIGLAFQIQDDVLDETSDVATLGKAVGADRRSGRPTYPAVAGISVARERIRTLHERASTALAAFGPDAMPLRLISDWLLMRRN